MMYDVRWGGALFSYNLQGSKGEGIGARKWRKDKKVLKSAQKTKKNLDKCAEFDIWSNDYFLQLADRMVFKE